MKFDSRTGNFGNPKECLSGVGSEHFAARSSSIYPSGLTADELLKFSDQLEDTNFETYRVRPGSSLLEAADQACQRSTKQSIPVALRFNGVVTVIEPYACPNKIEAEINHLQRAKEGWGNPKSEGPTVESREAELDDLDLNTDTGLVKLLVK